MLGVQVNVLLLLLAIMVLHSDALGPLAVGYTRKLLVVTVAGFIGSLNVTTMGASELEFAPTEFATVGAMVS